MIFGKKRKRGDGSSGGGSNSSLQIEDLREEVPEVSDTIRNLDHLIAQSDRLTGQKRATGICGCWGGD